MAESTREITVILYKWQYEIFSPTTGPEMWVESDNWYFTLSACQKAAREEEMEVPDCYARRLNIISKCVEVTIPSDVLKHTKIMDK